MADCAMHMAGMQALPVPLADLRALPLDIQHQARAMLDGVRALVDSYKGGSQRATISKAGAAALLSTTQGGEQYRGDELRPGDVVTLADGTGIVIAGLNEGEDEDVELS
jgi:hypothetical protein